MSLFVWNIKSNLIDVKGRVQIRNKLKQFKSSVDFLFKIFKLSKFFFFISTTHLIKSYFKQVILEFYNFQLFYFWSKVSMSLFVWNVRSKLQQIDVKRCIQIWFVSDSGDSNFSLQIPPWSSKLSKYRWASAGAEQLREVNLEFVEILFYRAAISAVERNQSIIRSPLASLLSLSFCRDSFYWLFARWKLSSRRSLPLSPSGWPSTDILSTANNL